MRNMRIGARISTGFLLVMLLLALVAGVSVYNVNRLDGEINSLAKESWRKSKLLDEIKSQMDDVSISSRNMVMTKYLNVMKQEEAVITRASEQISQRIDELEKMPLHDSARKMLGQIKAKRSVYRDKLKHFLDLNNARQYKDAAALLQGELEQEKKEYIKVVEELAQFQDKEVERIASESARLASSTRNAIIALGLAALVVGALLARYIISSITVPLHACVEAAEKLGAGATSIEFTAVGQDEIGTLQTSLEKVCGAVGLLVSDGRLLTDAALAGRLSTRSDATRHQGEYRAVIEGFNATLDAVVGPLNVTAEYMDRISKGDIPPRITESYNGDFNEIKNNLNVCIDAVSQLVSDGKLLADAALAGRLAARADAARHQGEFRAVIQGFNATLDAVVGPLNVSAEYVDRISKGDIPPRITESYNGDFNEIKNNLNVCIDAVSRLVSDGKLLTEAALAGRLATRADAGRHQGEFRAIVEGFNATLDAVVGPLNVSAEYMDRISKGDIPPRITENYNGDFNEIKNNLNVCIDAVSLLVSDGRLLTDAALAGRLATRSDATRHQGEFRTIIEGFNATLDAVLGPLNVTAEYMDRISKGDIPPRITESYNGDFNEIKNNLNVCIDAVSLLVSDGRLLTEATLAGRLAIRSDATRHQGEFRTIIEGFNATLDAVVAPINDVRRVMEAMEKGDLSRRMTSDARGDFAALKESLNGALEALVRAIANVTSNARQVASASAQTSGAVGQISDGSQNQLHAIGQVATAVKQTAASIADVARNTEEASLRAKDSVAIVNEGQLKMAQMVEVVGNISSNSEKINKITDVIEKIANKTNLLSLNAAIEAARAGEHGRGFAVVAEEVGKLAANAAESTQEIVALVSQAVREANHAVSTVNEVSGGMRRISEGALQTESMLQRISAALEEQSTAVQEINVNIASLNKVAESNAAASEEITATVVELAKLADNTRKEAEQFRL